MFELAWLYGVNDADNCCAAKHCLLKSVHTGMASANAPSEIDCHPGAGIAASSDDVRKAKAEFVGLVSSINSSGNWRQSEVAGKNKCVVFELTHTYRYSGDPSQMIVKQYHSVVGYDSDGSVTAIQAACEKKLSKEEDGKVKMLAWAVMTDSSLGESGGPFSAIWLAKARILGYLLCGNTFQSTPLYIARTVICFPCELTFPCVAALSNAWRQDLMLAPGTLVVVVLIMSL
jgi:hypothetical protein